MLFLHCSLALLTRHYNLCRPKISIAEIGNKATSLPPAPRRRRCGFSQFTTPGPQHQLLHQNGVEFHKPANVCIPHTPSPEVPTTRAWPRGLHGSPPSDFPRPNASGKCAAQCHAAVQGMQSAADAHSAIGGGVGKIQGHSDPYRFTDKHRFK